jgi:hypothetical protein
MTASCSWVRLAMSASAAAAWHRPHCPSCQGRMRPLAVIKESASIARYLAAVGEATEVPRRSPARTILAPGRNRRSVPIPS